MYFLEEERANSYVYGDYSMSAMKLHITASKKHMVFTTVFAIFMVLALSINGIRYGWYTSSESLGFGGWIDKLLDVDDGGYMVLLFMVATLLFFGTSTWFYAAIGIGVVPITMIMEDRLSTRIEEDQSDDEEVGYSNISDAVRYTQSNRYIYSRDRLETERNRDEGEEPSLWEEIPITRSLPPGSSRKRIKTCLNASLKFIGCCFLLIYVLYVVSLGVSLIDRASNSSRRWDNGFMINYKSLYNPFDEFLLLLSNHAFPLDLVFIGLTQILILAATLQGVIESGVRFLCLRIHNIESRSTEPHILILAVSLILIAGATLHVQMLSFAPEYSNYGPQKAEGGGPCDLLKTGNSGPYCFKTGIGYFMTEVILNNPLAGDMMFMVDFIVCSLAFVSIGYAFYRSTDKRLQRKQYQLQLDPFSVYDERDRLLAYTA